LCYKGIKKIMSNLQSNKFIEVTLLHKGKKGQSDFLSLTSFNVGTISVVIQNRKGTANIQDINCEYSSTEESYEEVIKRIKDAQA